MANQLIIEGKIFKIDATQQIKDTFKKREFIVETEEQYPQKVKFEFTQEKCDFLGSDADPVYKTGDKVKISFNIRGSEWQSKYYVNLQAWKIERNTENAGQSQSNEQGTSTMETPQAFQKAADTVANNSDNDDLPF